MSFKIDIPNIDENTRRQKYAFEMVGEPNQLMKEFVAAYKEQMGCDADAPTLLPYIVEDWLRSKKVKRGKPEPVPQAAE